MNEREQRLQRQLETAHSALNEECATVAALRQQLAEKDKQLHCMELRAKSAEAIANMTGVDITRPMVSVRVCDCCEQSGPTVKYHDAAGYLCDKCEPKVMAARESVRQHLQREAELQQQLAEKESDFKVVKLAVIETEGRCAEFKAMLDDTLKQEFAVRQQLAEARAERDGFQCQLKAFDKLHWELVDMFDKDARGVSPLHYVKERIAAQAAELERVRKELARSTNYITDDCEYPHHVWFANGRHVELVYPQGRSVLNVDMQLHESFSKKDGDE